MGQHLWFSAFHCCKQEKQQQSALLPRMLTKVGY